MIFLEKNKSGTIDMTDTMYPSKSFKIISKNEIFKIPDYSTAYGIVIDGEITLDNGTKTLRSHEYFCISGDKKEILINGHVQIFVRFGFKGQNLVGGPVEESGRLCYIDNCSDTLLVYPPRLGDASMSLLSFPPNITQRFHTHPSIRLGIIIRGKGYAETPKGKFLLEPGIAFCVKEREIHRFITENDNLDAISFHPDGDWGPTDDNHTLLNRTYSGIFMQGKT